MKLFRFFNRAVLEPEAFVAYFNRLPSQVRIHWFRDGKCIVGNIEADGERFMTQGRNAEEFIDMVNETIYAVYNIPEAYHSVLLQKRKYRPDPQEYERLKDEDVRSNSLAMKKAPSPKLA